MPVSARVATQRIRSLCSSSISIISKLSVIRSGISPAKSSSSRSRFDPQMHTKAMERLRMEMDLRRAIERDQLLLHYQPVVSLTTGGVVAVEALIRWQHPERGLIPPLDFIPVAERTGMIGDIGQWVLVRACEQLKSWEREFGYDAPQS